MTNRKAIVTLTRGYTNYYYYDIIVNRNKSIESNLFDKTIDILIFYEGNISESDQEWIAEQTPTLNIKFINITEYAFQKNKESIVIYDTYKCHFGYRHMCHFWFVDFWKYVEDYDKILRIDEDCLIFSNIDIIFEKLETKVALYGQWEPDEDFVTIGLNNFTRTFLENNNIYNTKSHNPSGPYTNLIAINIVIAKSNVLLQKYIDAIDTSDNIYSYRWGDLPLWGEALYYLFDEEQHNKDINIKYIHYVNGIPVKVNME